ncbi:MAG: MBOAT family protein [Lachnospiraceae bacterium]|nr:MBOAT family protein [Lachnospiraceae bacterium]
MVFSSLVFISIFLPVVLILYWILPGGSVRPADDGGEGATGLFAKNLLLLAASLLFYAYGEPVYVFLMVITALLNYLWARLLVRMPTARKRIMTAAVVQNLGVLAVFKYAGFLAELWNGLGIFALPVPEIELPIGISFFTFQALSYVIDVYRGEVEAEHSVFRVMLYISFFPQLIAGPIVKYHDIAEELNHRSLTMEGVLTGIRRFAVGLAKKVLIANYMAVIVDTLFLAEAAEMNVCVAWLGAIAYMLQIYFDFSGYSDMAIGLGWMFGFHFKENFNYPYIASSMKDFWRRWHISLSTWFREYLYFPLGGNRKGKLRTGVNKVIVFACTGIWHGASLTFLFWGLYHGFFLLMEEWLPALWANLTGRLRGTGKADAGSQKEHAVSAGAGPRKERAVSAEGDARKASGANSRGGWLGRFFGHVYVVLAVMIGFVFFRAETFAQGLFWVKTMFTGFTFDNASMQLFMAMLTPLNLTAMAAGLVASTPLLRRLEKKKACQALSWPVALVLLALSMLCLAGGTYNPFIYFRF